MALRSILIAPDPRLRRQAMTVTAVDAKANRLMQELLEIMREVRGLGLAAPQVGVNERIIVLESMDGQPSLCMANPRIIHHSSQTALNSEGCLSFPDLYAEVERFQAVGVGYLDRENQSCELEAKGLRAACLQHEIDHLDGILFIDRISHLKRDMILRKLRKAQRSGSR